MSQTQLRINQNKEMKQVKLRKANQFGINVFVSGGGHEDEIKIRSKGKKERKFGKLRGLTRKQTV